MEKITKEFMILMGFKLEKSLGGSMMYYYEPLYFSGNFYFSSDIMRIAYGTLSIQEEKVPESKEALVEMLRNIHIAYGEFLGKNAIQNELKQLLGL